jgi:hypothetical protein
VSNYKRMFVMPYVWERYTTENRCNLACGTWPNSVNGTALNIPHLSTTLTRAVGSRPRLCYPKGKSTRYPVNGDWEGPRVDLEAFKNRNTSSPGLKSNHIPWLSNQLHDHYTKWSIPCLLGMRTDAFPNYHTFIAWRSDRIAREILFRIRLNRTTRNNVGSTKTVNAYKLMAWLQY